jgi:hypothetical protein
MKSKAKTWLIECYDGEYSHGIEIVEQLRSSETRPVLRQSLWTEAFRLISV